MDRFFRTQTRIVGVAQIVSIEEMPHKRDGRTYCQVRLTDRTTDLAWGTLDEIEAKLCGGPILPAPPGYRAIEAVWSGPSGSPLEFFESDVLAFQYGSEPGAEPLAILLDGRLGGWCHGIRRPDGLVCVPYHSSGMSEDEFRAYAMETLKVREGGGAD
jgi:hypothetical protein